MKLKPDCCKKYRTKARACKRCPVMAVLGKKKRKRRLAKIRRRLRKAA